MTTKLVWEYALWEYGSRKVAPRSVATKRAAPDWAVSCAAHNDYYCTRSPHTDDLHVAHNRLNQPIAAWRD